MPSNYRQQDPYSGQKSRGIAQINGGKGAATSSSAINAYQQSKGTADPYAAFGNLSAAWSGALAPRAATGINQPGSIPAYGTDGKAASGFRPSSYQPLNEPPTPTYRGPNGEYGGGRPATGRPPMTPSTQPVEGYQPYRFDYGYGPGVDPHFAPPGTNPSGTMPYQPANIPPMVTYSDPATGGTTHTNPNRNSGFNPSGPPLPMTGTGGIAGYSPFAQPIGDNMPYEEIRRRLQTPDDRYAAPVAGGGTFMRATPDTERPFPASTLPPQAAPRPPATPSTQPPTPSTQPTPGRPPATPSTQPVTPWQPVNTPPIFEPGPGHPSNPTNPSPYQPANIPPMVTYFDPATGGTTTRNPNVPSGGATRTPVGMTGPDTPQFTPNGLPFGSNGVGRRYAAPEDPASASGRRNATYKWFKKPDGTTEMWETDANGNPVTRTQTGRGPQQGAQVANWPGTGNSTPGGSSQTGTSTTTGTTSAPNNTTTFDPSVLPQSDAGKWLDPVYQDTMDKMTRQLRHEGSLTGATNSGGFIPGMTEALAPVANQFAKEKGGLMFQDQQAKADRLLDQYKFDNTQQLTEWIKKNEFKLQQAGIDANVLMNRYSADAGVKSAGIGASASTAAARIGADASRNNAWLDYMQGMAGIGANYGLGQDRLGYDYYNSNQNYGLGQQQLGYNYWNSGQQRQYDDMFNQRGYDLGMTGINRDVYGMDQAQQRYLMDLMWRMSPGGQMGGGYFPSPGVFPYGG